MPAKPFRPTLTVRVVYVADPDAHAARERSLDILADALADLAIAEARAEVAQRLGKSEETIDREAQRLDGEAVRSAELRGVA
jgi:hypothetical protein